MKELLRINEVKDITGVSIPSIRRWIRLNQCPWPFTRTPGGRLLFSAKGIEKWLDDIKNQPRNKAIEA